MVSILTLLLYLLLTRDCFLGSSIGYKRKPMTRTVAMLLNCCQSCCRITQKTVCNSARKTEWRLCSRSFQYVQVDGYSSHPYIYCFQQFRRRDPVDADETEFMENVFDALCSASSEASIKRLFLESEGPDLMVLMMKFVSLFIVLPIMFRLPL